MRRFIDRHLGVPAAVAPIITGNVIRRCGGTSSGSPSSPRSTRSSSGSARILDVPLAGTIAVVVFVTAYVPFIGAFVSGAFAVLLALASQGTTTAVIMLVIVILANGLLQNIVQPIAFGATLDLNPLVVLIVTIGFGAHLRDDRHGARRAAHVGGAPHQPGARRGQGASRRPAPSGRHPNRIPPQPSEPGQRGPRSADRRPSIHSSDNTKGGCMSTFDLEEREVIESAARAWWVFLLTGLLWLLFAIIVLRFDYTTVTAVSILFGMVAIAAGINEFFMLAASHRWWKVLHGLLGVIFVVVGIIAFVHPGDTFAALAAVISFFLIFKGFFDIVVSIATREEIHIWWVQLIAGIAEVLIGFWAAGYWGRSAILLVIWVGVIALMRGITEIIFAFKLRSAGKAAGGGGPGTLAVA